MTFRTVSLLTFAALAVPLTAAPVLAGPAGSVTLLGGYWTDFIDHWSGVFQRQNGIVMGTLLVGAVALFIITRGKWRK
jgi:hypothetical protein